MIAPPSPNKKYTVEMFEHTEKLLFEGKKKYVARGETLEHFGFEWEKENSYRKRFDEYIKEKQKATPCELIKKVR